MSLAELTPGQKEELVVSLSALLLHDSSADISSENLEAVIKVSVLLRLVGAEAGWEGEGVLLALKVSWMFRISMW